MQTKPRIEIDSQQVETLAAQGLTNEQIAAALGISRTTLQSRKRENEQFEQALIRGRARGIAVVTNRFFEIIQAKDNEGQYVYDADTRLNAMKFFMERRGGWVRQEQNKVDLTSSDKSMSPLDVRIKVVDPKQTDE